MAQFPRFVHPRTPGGIDPIGLNQKMLNVDPLMKSIQQSNARKQKPKGVGSKKKEDDLLEGRIGAVNQYYQNVNNAMDDISMLESTYGDLASMLPEYQKATQRLDYYTSPEFQNIIARETKEFDDYSKLVTDNKGGHLYHLGEWQRTKGANAVDHKTLLRQQEYGYTANLPNVYGNVAETAEGMIYPQNYDRDLDLDPNFYNRKDAHIELDRIFNPADNQMKWTQSSADIAYHVVQGAFADIEGVKTTHRSGETDYEQLGFASQEAQDRFASGALDLTDPLVAGYLQAFLQTTGGGEFYNGVKIKDDNGEVSEAFYEQFHGFVAADIQNHWAKRVTENKDVRKTFNEQSDFAYKVGIANKEIVEVTNTQFLEPGTAVVEANTPVISGVPADLIADIQTNMQSMGMGDALIGPNAVFTTILNPDGTETTHVNGNFYSTIDKMIAEVESKPMPDNMKSTQIQYLHSLKQDILAKENQEATRKTNDLYVYPEYKMPMNVTTTATINKGFEGKDGAEVFDGVPIQNGIGSYSDSKSLLGWSFDGTGGDMILGNRPLATNWDENKKTFVNPDGSEASSAGYYSTDSDGSMLLRPHSKESLEAVNGHNAKYHDHENIMAMSHATYYQTGTFTLPKEKGQKWMDEIGSKLKVYGNETTYAPYALKGESERVAKALKATETVEQTAPVGTIGTVKTGPSRSDADKLSETEFKTKYGMTKAEARSVRELRNEYPELSENEFVTQVLDHKQRKQGKDPTKFKRHAVQVPVFKPGTSYNDVVAAVQKDDIESVMNPSAAKVWQLAVDEDGNLIRKARVDVSPLIHRNATLNKNTRKIFVDRQLNYGNELVSKNQNQPIAGSKKAPQQKSTATQQPGQQKQSVKDADKLIRNNPKAKPNTIWSGHEGGWGR